MEIKGVEIDLKEIGISFTPNDEQLQALDHLIDFLQSDCLTTVLSGSAGTGKTSIIKILLEYIKKTSKINVTLAAPTHKAKMVLSRLSNDDNAFTLHTLLKLRPNMDILEFDANDLQFMFKNAANLFDYEDDLIIVDEGSMIPDPLYDLAIQCMKRMGKMIFLGDMAQIQPVKQGKLSKVFSSTDYPGFNLTKVERQKKESPLVEPLLILRDRSLKTFKSATLDGNGLLVHKSPKDFARELKESLPSLKELVKSPFKNKSICWTNHRAGQLNQLTRRLLGTFGSVIETGELVMAHDSFTRNEQPILYNGSEYVVVGMKYGTQQLPYFSKVPGYHLRLLDTVDAKNKGSLECISNVFLLDPNMAPDLFGRLVHTYENMRLTAVESRGYSKKICWKCFHELHQSFITPSDMVYQGRVVRKKSIDYGYAITVHKSQGSTYENTFIDMKDILLCRQDDELRQLQYVAVSRASKMVHLLN